MSRKISYTATFFSRDLAEYRVKAYDAHGKHMPAADYFTDDRNDAEQSAIAMVRTPAEQAAADRQYDAARRSDWQA